MKWLTVEWDSYHGQVAFLFIKIIIHRLKVRLSVLTNWLSRRLFDADLSVLPHWRRNYLKQPTHHQKAAFETKESNYWYPLSGEWNTSHSCNASTFILCVLCVCTCAHWCACFRGHFPALPSGPFKLHTLLRIWSLQPAAHSEMRFKTAINIELCGEKKGKGSDFKIVLSGVGSNHNGAFGKRQREKDVMAVTNC